MMFHIAQFVSNYRLCTITGELNEQDYSSQKL